MQPAQSPPTSESPQELAPQSQEPPVSPSPQTRRGRQGQQDSHSRESSDLSNLSDASSDDSTEVPGDQSISPRSHSPVLLAPAAVEGSRNAADDTDDYLSDFSTEDSTGQFPSSQASSEAPLGSPSGSEGQFRTPFSVKGLLNHLVVFIVACDQVSIVLRYLCDVSALFVASL